MARLIPAFLRLYPGTCAIAAFLNDTLPVRPYSRAAHPAIHTTPYDGTTVTDYGNRFQYLLISTRDFYMYFTIPSFIPS